jgi:hypothetical protein
MKTQIISMFLLRSRHGAGTLALIALALALPGALRAQSDNFDSGNDSDWNRYDPFYGPPINSPIATYSFPNGGYRIQTTVPPVTQYGPGRAGSVREQIYYTNFFVAVDVVGWNDTLPQAFGVLGRVNEPALGTTSGYAFTYDRGNPPSPTSGMFDISIITDEAPDTISSGPSSLHLDPTKAYRFTFQGRGTALEGRVYELPNTTTPLLTLTANDGRYCCGYGGLVVFDNNHGQSATDATFDNFLLTTQPAPRLTYWIMPDQQIMVGWPLDVTGFTLQANTDLTGSEWMNLISSDLGNGYQGMVESTSSGNQFYRLIGQ